MKKRIISGVIGCLALAIFVVACISILSGCAPSATNVAVPEEKTNFEAQSAENEKNASKISSQYGVPSLTRSQDYENIVRRAEYLNQANNVGYIYLLTSSGALVREEQVLGKVTSLNSYITPMEDVLQVEEPYRRYEYGAYPGTYVTVEAPDLDGTYGENVAGVFWFTPDGVYREWTGEYLFSAERLTFTVEPILVTTVR